MDDDTGILYAFNRIFERKGYVVTVAERGDVAVEKLHQSRFDVALVDFTLPDMEGSELFPLIKKMSPKTLRIMLTGKTWLQNTAVAADVFIEKPVNPEKLLSIIDTKLKNRDAEE